MLPPIRVFSACLLATLALFGPTSIAAAQSQPASRVPLHRTRTSPSDLEIGGDLAGVPHGETRFVRYTDLLHLPQQNFVAHGDTNFVGPVRIGGILLERLPAFLGAEPDAQMVTALCDDFYKANYPADYLDKHHPVLVLRINGHPPARWPKSLDGPSMGPYMISHASFSPSFHVFAHTDEAQIPWGVVRLDFRRETEVYAGIRPSASNKNEAVQEGYTIARQNCFRCHNADAEGGTKAGLSWQVVADISVTNPQTFDNYVRDPKSNNPASQMAASPGYDSATLIVLRTYFKSFAEVPKK